MFAISEWELLGLHAPHLLNVTETKNRNVIFFLTLCVSLNSKSFCAFVLHSSFALL